MLIQLETKNCYLVITHLRLIEEMNFDCHTKSFTTINILSTKNIMRELHIKYLQNEAKTNG